jgi:4-hydroxy-3-polyprenylbenzoate decarboxylase
MKVHKVYARKNAIWPFTVVGRPPQEDTSFGELIHEMTGAAIPKEIPGVKEVHAVDAAGVHPLLLAIGSERYTPFMPAKKPAEILTIANHILGTGQLSLAKYLFITADDENKLSTHDISAYFSYMLQRIDLKRDLHFHTQTTIDTLDYSGDGFNSGSKVVLAAYGEKIRELGTIIPDVIKKMPGLTSAKMVMPGVIAIQTGKYTNDADTVKELNNWNDNLRSSLNELNLFPMITWCDDANFTADTLNNFLWVTFTRSNPATDIHGIESFTAHKHWGCNGPMIIDARIKPHHAPPLVMEPVIENKIDKIFEKGGSLFSALRP